MSLPRLKPGMTGEELQKITAEARRAGALLKVLSHQTRLLILCILADGEKTVGEMETILNIQQAMVSQQLARLRMERLVSTRRNGRLVYYSIANAHVTALVASLFGMFQPGEG
ncbi:MULTISPECIES: ArsR/SmtB family transcription factor [unclassified Sinorhizobium]|uniref:ArsR/SmtB family transcription factor n=1 Tax=unclassified Sinorhizobium TaxID=2613772 RepID=UPI0035255F68